MNRQWTDRLKTWSLVTIVAVLIWTYAEGRSLQMKPVSFLLGVGAPEGAGRIVQVLDEGWSGRAEVTLKGAAAAVDTLSELLRGPVRLTAGAGLPLEPGTHVVSLKDALLAEYPAFREHGVSITTADPANIRVRIDALVVLKDVPVRVVIPDAQLVGMSEPDPPVVTLSYPAAYSESVGSSPYVTAHLSADDLLAGPDGRRFTLPNIALQPPEALLEADHVTIDPPIVSVALTLQSRTSSTLIRSVPVQLQLPPIEQPNWLISVPEEDRYLRDVTVTGPSELIGRIESDDLRVFAVVRLTLEDLESAITEKEAAFSELPTPLEFKAENRVVHLEIQRRAEGETEPGAGQ